MISLETAYNLALEKLEKGHSLEEVLLDFAEVKNELAPLLEISLQLSTLPKNIAPEPAMQRKYALAPSKTFWLAWFHVSKFAGVSMSLLLLISAFTATGYATLNSAPGQTLFTVKKIAEQSQMLLAYNQDQKANLQVALTQKRLDEAKQIFNNPNSNPGQEQAALQELSSQTSNAVATVNSATQSNPQSDSNHPLVNSLEAITKEQQNLLADIKPSSPVKADANSAQLALNQNSAKISEIKQFVAVASSDQALTKLNADPNSVAVLGEINQVSKDQITVEKTTFNITSGTVIKDSDGKVLNAEDLKQKIKVNVVGLKDKNNLIAQQILVTTVTTASTTTPEVKGESTSTILTTSDKNPTASSTIFFNNPTKQENDNNTNTAVGSYILEDPAPQFSGN